MPYITPEARRFIMVGNGAESGGDLNYLLTETILLYLEEHWKTREKYEAMNQVVGALECCKLEFYRRLCAPYEDKKIKENGDVY